ncbi:MAG: zinc ribbon domain-containing protein [Candidatus Dormibacteraeota bacterium]|nr:zinc ribbon domain-containing protein [Candidatus Dormibacteraeota bacterium]
MPIYEFSCLSCRHTFEVLGNFASRGERQVCPSCEGTNTRALFSMFAVTGGEAASKSSGAGSGACGCGGGCACSN